jgi:cobalt transporter subunit CbtB
MSMRITQAVYPLSQAAVPALLILFGLVLLLAVGFAPGVTLHEFLHDGRHLFAFPCD